MTPEKQRAILEALDATKKAGGQRYEEPAFPGPFATDIYVGEERYRAEIERVFWRSWLPIARVAELAENESWLHRTIAGSEVLITRDAGGALHAFHNTCMHRGTALVEADGHGKCVVCPYHAWTYELDGRLANVPDSQCLPPGGSETHLAPVALDTFWGYIWVNLAKNPPELRDFLGADIIDELEDFHLEGWEHKSRAHLDGEFNWKVPVEGMCEPYHVPFVHRRTVNPVLHTKYVIMDCFGDHSRMVMPLRDPRMYEPDGVLGRGAAAAGIGIPATLSVAQRTTSTSTFLWPNTVFNILPNHIATQTVVPLAPQRSRIVTDVYGPPTESEAQREYWIKLAATYEPLVAEDNLPSVRVQRGLSGAFQPRVVLTHYDRRVRHFRSRLDAWMLRPPG